MIDNNRALEVGKGVPIIYRDHHVKVAEPARIGRNSIPSWALASLNLGTQAGLCRLVVGPRAVHYPKREARVIILDILYSIVIILKVLGNSQLW